MLALLGLRIEYLAPWQAWLLFLAPAALIVFLGMRSMRGMSPGRKYTAIALRVLLLAVLVLIVAGLRLERRSNDVGVIVVRDISLSTARMQNFPGPSLNAALDKFVADVSKAKKPDDQLGLISFAQQALIETMPTKVWGSGADTSGGNAGAGAWAGGGGGGVAVREITEGTDIGAALQLALATFDPGTMKRIVLVTDGNNTLGDLDSALNLAASQKIPVDVVPLEFESQGEVLMERMSTPTWRRENEPFTMDVVLRNASLQPTRGKLSVLHQGRAMALGASGETSRVVTLRPGVNVERVNVPPLKSAGVHEFKAVFEPEDPATAGNITAQSGTGEAGGGGATGGAGGGKPSAILAGNRTANSFTFVQGKGQILYVNNVNPRESGLLLAEALRREGIDIAPENIVTPQELTRSFLRLQNYDAIILANVPHGIDGLSDEQERSLAAYVHDSGGGLVMIGGEQSFGAGGWSGTELEKVLPLDMDVPSRREIAKGALVLLMHSCEMPDGNYWGEQCAIKALETLSERDEIGVLSFAWKGPGGGGSQWDYPLSPKGDGSRVLSAIKAMQLGDMISFDDSFSVALNGRGGNPGLKDSDAKQKHMIVISDGDPGAPSEQLYQDFIKAKITVSTVSVYPHDLSDQGLPPTMRRIAERLKGRAYGPINNNPQQLPQIFIKEATVVKRSLIQEDAKGFRLAQSASLTDAIKGIAVPDRVTGYVLTSRKNSPQVETPIVASNREADPILAYWQTGLGRAVAFTSDAHNRWAASWYASPIYDRFWAQVVRAVARPPMNAELDVQAMPVGGVGSDKSKVVVEAARAEGNFEGFLNIRGTVVGPDLQPRDVRLVQTAPGTYEAVFDTPLQGNYVLSLRYNSPDGRSGFLLSGLSRGASAELRDLRSNDAAIQEIARRTGGRVLPAFRPEANDWFNRAGLAPVVFPLPIWERLIPLALLLLLLDVAVRRIALDRATLRSALGKAAAYIRGYTATTPGDAHRQRSLEALRKKRDEVQQSLPASTGVPLPPSSTPEPNVEGNLSDLVGGANPNESAARPAPELPKTQNKGDPVSGLLAAKKRAAKKIEERKQE